MAKNRKVYVCTNCGNNESQWMGQCPMCGEWNTFEEEIISQKAAKNYQKSKKATSKAVSLSKVSPTAPKRLSTKIDEFNRVLGGGFVPGQVVLLAGAPGVGKSTILTEIAKSLKNKNVLYVCGEESANQIKLRTQRMNYDAQNLLMLADSNVDSISNALENNPEVELVIVDSIQTIFSEEFAGVAGSLSQVRGGTQQLTEIAKRKGIPMVLVGHITKKGVVAGPKVLEHIVDTVLYLEGDRQHMFRILRTSKNRFGPVSEVGIFEMVEKGMKEVKNPSKLFLEQRAQDSSGSCVTVLMEGYRPLLFEIQALTVRTSFGYPRRTASGISNNRLQVLIATLEKRAGLDLSGHDVYLSVAGGFKVTEYAADLAICMAIASSLKDKPIKSETVIFGECGLGGEIRRVPHQDQRVKEANNLGYKNIIGPHNAKSLRQALQKSI